MSTADDAPGVLPPQLDADAGAAADDDAPAKRVCVSAPSAALTRLLDLCDDMLLEVVQRLPTPDVLRLSRTNGTLRGLMVDSTPAIVLPAPALPAVRFMTRLESLTLLHVPNVYASTFLELDSRERSSRRTAASREAYFALHRAAPLSATFLPTLERLQNLRKLRVMGMQWFKPHFLTRIARRAPQLSEIALGSSCISDQAFLENLIEAVTSLQDFRRLELWGQLAGTSEALLMLLACMPRLEHLHLGSLNGISITQATAGFQQFGDRLFAALPRTLRVLCLRESQQQQLMVTAPIDLPALEVLDLANCTYMPMNTIDNILASSARRLKKLNLTMVQAQMSGVVVDDMIGQLSQVEELYLSYFQQNCFLPYDAITRSCGRLRILSVNWNQMTDQEFASLFTALPHLEVVQANASQRLTTVDVHGAARLRSLEIASSGSVTSIKLRECPNLLQVFCAGTSITEITVDMRTRASNVHPWLPSRRRAPVQFYGLATAVTSIDVMGGDCYDVSAPGVDPRYVAMPLVIGSNLFIINSAKDEAYFRTLYNRRVTEPAGRVCNEAMQLCNVIGSDTQYFVHQQHNQLQSINEHLVAPSALSADDPTAATGVLCSSYPLRFKALEFHLDEIPLPWLGTQYAQQLLRSIDKEVVARTADDIPAADRRAMSPFALDMLTHGIDGWRACTAQGLTFLGLSYCSTVRFLDLRQSPKLATVRVFSCENVQHIEFAPESTDLLDIDVRHCHRMQHFNLSHLRSLETFLSVKLDDLPQLEAIDVSECRYVRLLHVSACPKLESLEANSCPFLVSLLLSDECAELARISLRDCINITDQVLDRFLRKAPALSYLLLSGCDVTEATMRLVKRACCDTLMELHVKKCAQILSMDFREYRNAFSSLITFQYDISEQALDAAVSGAYYDDDGDGEAEYGADDGGDDYDYDYGDDDAAAGDDNDDDDDDDE